MTVASGPLPDGPRVPEHGLPIVSLDVDWTPPQIVAGDVGALAEALAEVSSEGRIVELRLGPPFEGEAWETQTAQMISALAPGVAIEAGPPRSVTSMLAADTRLGLDRVGAPSPWEPPRYDPKSVSLAPSPLGRLASEGASGAPEAFTLTIDRAPIDQAVWDSLPAHARGDCGSAFEALALGQEQSLAYLETFLDHADALLWKVYRAELQTYLPSLAQELGPFAEIKSEGQFEDPRQWERYQCGHAYWEYLQNFTACGDDLRTCPSAPRVFLVGGARIGSAEPSFFVDEQCPNLVGRDYALELRNLAVEASEVARDSLDPSWSTLADRLGTITELHAALEDVCTPRRRRFAQADLEEARRRLTEIGYALAADPPTETEGQWTVRDGQFHVPGVGAVRQVATFETGRGSEAMEVVAQSRALRQFVLGRALCRSGHDPLPLVVVGAEPGVAHPDFLGYFYREELFCADLPPAGVQAE